MLALQSGAFAACLAGHHCTKLIHKQQSKNEALTTGVGKLYTNMQ